MERQLDSLTGLGAAAAELLAAFPESRVFAFHGDLGAGKTTFIKAICEALGVKDAMSSPSFAIVNEYHDQEGRPVYHFDLYRLRRPEEAFDIGLEEYLYSGHYCFIEWPEKAEELLPGGTVQVRISVNEGKRLISAH